MAKKLKISKKQTNMLMFLFVVLLVFVFIGGCSGGPVVATTSHCHPEHTVGEPDNIGTSSNSCGQTFD